MSSFPFNSNLWKSCRAELVQYYGQPGRYYHNLSHVNDCLDQLHATQESDDRDSLKLALWFHDAIYDLTRSDNEKASADLAIDWLSRIELSQEKIDQVARLVQITDHKTLPETHDEKLIVDIDLSILGRDTDRYQLYATAIRSEYSQIPETEYRVGRSAVLQGFLARNSIYQTEWFRDQFEEQARVNLYGEILGLH